MHMQQLPNSLTMLTDHVGRFGSFISLHAQTLPYTLKLLQVKLSWIAKFHSFLIFIFAVCDVIAQALPVWSKF